MQDYTCLYCEHSKDFGGKTGCPVAFNAIVEFGIPAISLGKAGKEDCLEIRADGLSCQDFELMNFPRMCREFGYEEAFLAHGLDPGRDPYADYSPEDKYDYAIFD